jgi:hypothetical protein
MWALNSVVLKWQVDGSVARAALRQRCFGIQAKYGFAILARDQLHRLAPGQNKPM